MTTGKITAHMLRLIFKLVFTEFIETRQGVPLRVEAGKYFNSMLTMKLPS